MPTAANAESKFVTGAGALTAQANLDFTITIPKFVYVRIGTGTSMADNTNIDNLVYNVPAANVGDSSVISATSGGDIAAGQVTARVIGNNGTIAFSASTAGALSNGSGDSIPWTQIDVSAATITAGSLLAHPALVNGAGTPTNLTPNIGTKVTNLDARWTFTYKNNSIVPAGTYGGTVAKNGRVTYSAAMP